MEIPVNIYKSAIEVFGIENQLIVAIEELSELQKELCKYLRGETVLTNIAEEIADVEIMVEQLKIIFNCGEEVDRVRKYKLDRLITIIKNKDLIK